MDDADTTMAVARSADETLQARDGFGGGLAVQVEPVTGDVFSALQFSELTAIHAWSDEGIV